jgi:hypothetical protein
MVVPIDIYELQRDGYNTEMRGHGKQGGPYFHVRNLPVNVLSSL